MFLKLSQIFHQIKPYKNFLLTQSMILAVCKGASAPTNCVMIIIVIDFICCKLQIRFKPELGPAQPQLVTNELKMSHSRDISRNILYYHYLESIKKRKKWKKLLPNSVNIWYIFPFKQPTFSTIHNDDYCQAQPTSIKLQLSWLGWVSINFNFYPPTQLPYS